MKIGDSGSFYSSHTFLGKAGRLPLRKKMSLGFRVGNFAIAASYKLAVARILLKQI